MEKMGDRLETIMGVAEKLHQLESGEMILDLMEQSDKNKDKNMPRDFDKPEFSEKNGDLSGQVSNQGNEASGNFSQLGQDVGEKGGLSGEKGILGSEGLDVSGGKETQEEVSYKS
jgi:hypothetical protein